MPALRRATTRVAPTLAVLLLLAAPVAAQTAEDHYHDAARLYIAEDNAAAEAAALEGLALDPDDAKLRALLDKIRERNEQQSPQQQSGDGDPDEQQDADEQQQGYGSTPQDEGDTGPEQQSDEGTPDDQQPGGDQAPNNQQPEEPAEPEGEREGAAGAEGEQADGEAQPGGGAASPYDLKPSSMSRAEAERVLRALQADEVELLREVQRRRTRPRYVEKDW